MDESIFDKIRASADAKRERHEYEGQENVWDSPEVWLECGTSLGLRPTEDEVFTVNTAWARLVYQRMVKAMLVNIITLSTEPISPNHKLPLREIMRSRGETLEWLDMGRDATTGRKSMVRVVVPLDAPPQVVSATKSRKRR